MAATVPVLGLVHVHQPDVGFVDQGRGFERLSGLLLSEFLRRQAPQLIVDQWQELLRGVGIASLDGGQNAGNLTHRRHQEARKTRRNILSRPWARFGIAAP